MVYCAGAFAAVALFLSVGSVTAQEKAPDAPHVVEVTARDYEFEMQDQIPSGWVTFGFHNAGEEEHYFGLIRLPEGSTLQDFQTDVAAVFRELWNRYRGQRITRAEMLKTLRSELPQWYLDGTEPGGGPGLTEPGETTRVTVKLDPGTYVLECDIKTPQGSWHAFRGMTRELTVTRPRGKSSPPEADARLTLSNGEISLSGELTAGRQTVAVQVAQDPAGLANYAVQLVRLTEDTSLENIAEWLHPLELGQYRAPAPGHWLGGVQPMTVGSTGYLTVELTPGRYAWISPIYADQGMVREFTVERAGGNGVSRR